MIAINDQKDDWMTMTDNNDHDGWSHLHDFSDICSPLLASLDWAMLKANKTGQGQGREISSLVSWFSFDFRDQLLNNSSHNLSYFVLWIKW